ncbi:phage antirepressor KilAC domain-containing protein [Clostridium botulinum]|uniref:phage antirepressor KilAC domain-containing protein n=1 Tax=Clostridium botulinum TaxID=1491 RepID=UPI001E5C0E8C|nr:phage antirepressor KilAC domain-containing protein [Clostridium botulinum]
MKSSATNTFESNAKFSVGEVAKILRCGIGRNKLFNFLREQEIINSKNEPYQRFVDNGCLGLFTMMIYNNRQVTTPFVTNKGVKFIANLLIKNGFDIDRTILQSFNINDEEISKFNKNGDVEESNYVNTTAILKAINDSETRSSCISKKWALISIIISVLVGTILKLF